MHRLGPILEGCKPGERLFKGISPAAAMAVLRTLLRELNVTDPGDYRTHDFRRGHALDLQLSGAPLYVILAAGEWSSPAFLKYLDANRLETEAVVQAHVDDSGSDCD